MNLQQVRDKLIWATLEASTRFLAMQTPHKASCRDFTTLQEFKDGEVDVKDIAKKFPNGLQCLRIIVGSKQRTWAAISEIAVFTNHDQGASDVENDLDRVENKQKLSKLNPEINIRNSIKSDQTTNSEVKIIEIKDNKKTPKKKMTLEKLIREQEVNRLKMKIKSNKIK